MRKVWGMIACVFGALLITYLIQTLYIVESDPARAFMTSTPEPTRAALFSTPTPKPTLSPEESLRQEADTDFMKDRVNILLVGFDQSPEREDEDESVYRSAKNNYRSDVLMLAAINFAENSVHIISIPRDTFAEIYHTRGRWKINAAFAKGGAADGDGFLYAMKTVEMLMGVPVDLYAGVHMEGLKHLVDALGGVDYDVDVKIELNGRVLETGYQHLDGQQALDYVRARKGISTDLGRNDRQQRLILAIFRQLKSENKLTTLPAVYSAVKDDVYTNLTAAQIAALAVFALKLDETSFKRSTLAGEYVHNVYNASYYVLSNKKLAALVKNEFGVTIKRSSKYDLATVQRDKAAAEAAAAAKALEDVETMLVLPADTTGAANDAVYEAARVAAEQLLHAIDAGASQSEILRMRELYFQSVARLIDAYALTGPLPAALASLKRD